MYIKAKHDSMIPATNIKINKGDIYKTLEEKDDTSAYYLCKIPNGDRLYVRKDDFITEVSEVDKVIWRLKGNSL